MILHGKHLLTVLPLADLYTTYRENKRLKVFVHKGRKCATCDRVGTLLLLTEDAKPDKHGKHRQHVDLYTDDFILMTVDHIVPKSVARKIGWGKKAIERLTNKQTMCDPCNNSKGDKHISNEELAKNRKNAQPRLAGVEIIRQLVPNFHRINNDETWLAR